MKLFTSIKRALPITTIAFFSLAANAQKKIELKFNPANGSKYVISTTTKTVVSQMGMDINVNMKMDMNAAVSTQDPNKLLTLQYSNVALDMDMMGQKNSMSSNGTDPGSETLKKLTSKSFGCVFNKNGEILKVVGVDSLIAAIGAGSPATSYFSEDAIKSMMNQSFSVYPANPIAVGESWTRNMDVTSNVKLKAQVTYTLEKVENNLAYIKVNTNLASDGEQKVTVNGMEVGMDLKGTQNGEVVVDTKTGMFTTSNLTQDLKGNLSAMGQQIPMTVKSDVTASSTKQ